MDGQEVNPTEGQQLVAPAEVTPSSVEIPAQESTPAPQPEPLTRAELQAMLAAQRAEQARQFQSLVDKSEYRLRQQIKAAGQPYEQVLADPDIDPYLGEDGAELLRKKKLEAMGRVMSEQPEQLKQDQVNGVPIADYVETAHELGLQDDDPDMAQIDPSRFGSFSDWLKATRSLAKRKQAPPKPTIPTSPPVTPAAPVPVTVGLGSARVTTGLAQLREQHKAALAAGDRQKARALAVEMTKLA